MCSEQIKHKSASTVSKTSVLRRPDDCVGVSMLYKEDGAVCLAWDKADRLTYFGSSSAVGEPSKLSQAVNLEFWFRFDKSVFRISAGTTNALSWFSSVTADKFGNINLPRPSKKFPIFHPEKPALPLTFRNRASYI